MTNLFDSKEDQWTSDRWQEFVDSHSREVWGPVYGEYVTDWLRTIERRLDEHDVPRKTDLPGDVEHDLDSELDDLKTEWIESLPELPEHVSDTGGYEN